MKLNTPQWVLLHPTEDTVIWYDGEWEIYDRREIAREAKRVMVKLATEIGIVDNHTADFWKRVRIRCVVISFTSAR